MVLAGGWWVAIVELWPASSRPYIGGSQDNSILELTLGYNGFGRLTGDETGSVGGGGGGAGARPGCCGCSTARSAARSPGCCPAALVLGVGGLWFARARPTALRAGAHALAAAGCVVTALTFSFMAGIFHAYYTVALAPAIAALVGIGAWVLWQHRASLRRRRAARLQRPPLTSALAFVLLDRADGLSLAEVRRRWSSASPPPCARRCPRTCPRRVGVAVGGGGAAWPRSPGRRRTPSSTAATPHTGSIPSAGPSGGGRLRAAAGGRHAAGGHAAGQSAGASGGPGGTPAGRTGAASAACSTAAPRPRS